MNESVTVDQTSLEDVERRARHFWVSLIVGFLSLQVAIGIVAVYLAVSDPTVAVIPNYYQSAVNWDTTRRARELTGQLGWELTVNAGPVIAQEDHRQLRLEVRSRDQAPVDDLMVSAKVFHHARGTEIHKLRLSGLGEGIYVSPIPLTQAGLWQVELQLEGEHGIASLSQELIVR